MFVEYDFTIFIEPCVVSSFTAAQEVSDISYIIGQADLVNVGEYIFVESPVCNYPQTVTLTNLPIFLTHNAPASNDFTLPKTSDLSLLGEYTITIRAEIQVPNDYTQATFTAMFAEHEFVVYMEPCIVDDLTATTIVPKIIYNVNQPDLTTGFYQFEENPVCNYPQTVTLTNLPAFAIHNEPTSDFTIAQNNDLGLIGAYTVRIRSEVEVPDDYTRSTFTTKFAEYDFIIEVEGCTVDSYTSDQVITTISYNVGAPALTSPKYSFVETPACEYPQTVTVANLPVFVTHN